MAGLQSQNISVASTKLPGPSISEKDVCVFCRRSAAPSAADPHAPLFPFFSLVDCRHYACQPCALVHCDNAGRCIACPQCNCISRLAQSGRRRNRSSSSSAHDAAAGGGSAAQRVFIDDGVSSARSHRSATVRPSPHRSALKGQSGAAKKRSSSVQFPANPTTSIIDAETASVASNRTGDATHNADDAAEGGEGRRATSPLTQDAVAAIPLDPAEARRQRVRERQQRKAAAAAAQAGKSVSLYAITAAPPKPVSATAAGVGGDAAGGVARRSKERSHSQPVPKLPNTILEPRQVFPVPPPLVLHTIDEDEEENVKERRQRQRQPTAEEDAAASAGVRGETAGADAAATVGAGAADSKKDGKKEEDKFELPQFHRTQQDECANEESTARAVWTADEARSRTRLRQAMEEAEIAIHARRGLDGEFAATPLPTLTDLSDQVSATSDDELSQRSSAYKAGGGGSSSTSRRVHRTPRNSVTEGDGHAATTTASGQMSSASAVNTPSPMTAARATRPTDQAPSQLDTGVATAETEALERRLRAVVERDAAEDMMQLQQQEERARQLQRRLQAQRDEDAREAQVLAVAQRQRLELLESRTRVQLEATAEDEARLLAEKHQRVVQQLRRAEELREREAEEERELRQQRQQERTLLQEERGLAARRSLEERESLERDAVRDTEAAVRAHYVRNAEEWRAARIADDVAAQHAARAGADAVQRQHNAAHGEEVAARALVVSAEADEWAWLIAAARVDRVVAATEEGERVQREYDELRADRAARQFTDDVAKLVAEEQRGRRAFVDYEATTRSVVAANCTVQRDAAAAEEERLRREVAQKAAVRRAAASQQQWQRERDDVDADEAESRAVVREEEREERRTASMIFIQATAAVRRREMLASLADRARQQEAQESGAAEGLDVSPPPPSRPSPAYADQSQQQQQQAESARLAAEQMEELRLRQSQYEREMQAALLRLQEAERRVAEEAATRQRAEDERLASQAESERLLREAEQRAEQRIRDARDAAERLTQAQLADVRDEAARRAEHAAVMQSLAEEEQRAVLEAKLQAAERQLQQAQQRADDEVHRAREEAAALAAAEAARAAQEAQRREAEWQEHAHAERLLRLAERENEKEEAVRRLEELEARAAEAVRLAREEATRNAAAMEARIAEMERRQQARDAEVQQASQRVRHARDSMRDFDSRSPSSMHTTPSRAELLLPDSPQQQHNLLNSRRSSRRASFSVPTTPSRSEAAMAASTSSAVVPATVSPVTRGSAPTPPLAPSSSSPHPRNVSPTHAAAAAADESAFTPPHVVLGGEPGAVLSPAVSVSAAAAPGGVGGFAFDPAEVVRAAIREAVQEIVAAQQRAQTLQDQAERHVELSERRFQRRRSDQAEAAHEVVELQTSRMRSESEGSPRNVEHQQQQGISPYARSPIAPAASLHQSANTPPLSADRPRGDDSRGSVRRSQAESPLVRSPGSTPGMAAAAAAAVPMPSATAAPHAALSHTVSNTSSVYFDYQPSWTDAAARTAAAAAAGGPYHYQSLAPQQQHPSAASRVLFPGHSVPADAAATRPEQRPPSHAHPLPPYQVEGHAYNEPEPTRPITTTERSPPPRRSSTLADTEHAHAGTTAAAPEAMSTKATNTTATRSATGRVCPQCHRDDTTSPCWRCGETVCRRCGLPAGLDTKLCCSAHLRAELREQAQRKVRDATERAALQQQQQQQPRRGDQQVQTSFATTAENSEMNDKGEEEVVGYEVVPERYDAGTSTSVAHEPVSLIPPAAYYRPSSPQQQQQQQPQYYFDHPSGYANPVSVAAMTAPPPAAAAPVYLSGNPALPYGYAQPYPPQWGWQPPPPPQQQQQQWPVGRVPTPPPLSTAVTQTQAAVDVDVEDDAAQQQGRTNVSAKGSAPPSATARVASGTAQDHQTTESAARRAAQKAAQATATTTATSAASQQQQQRHHSSPTASAQQDEEEEQHAPAQQAVSNASTPDRPHDAPQEPKTERKPAAAAFFVALDDGAEEPRRPKPPTPCNYVPSKAFPAEGVRAAAAAHRMKRMRRPSPSPPAAKARGQQNSGSAAAAGGGKSRPALHDPYAAREYGARGQQQQQQRRASPSPYGAQQGRRRASVSPHTQARPSAQVSAAHREPVIASYMKVVAPMHPRFAEVRKEGDVGYVVMQHTAQEQQQRQQQQPAQTRQPHRPPATTSDSYSSYSSYSTSSTSSAAAAAAAEPPKEQRRVEETGAKREQLNPPSSRPSAAADVRPTAQHAPRNDSGVHAAADYLAQRPQLQPSHAAAPQQPRSAYYSYSSVSTATMDAPQPVRKEREETAPASSPHRYAPRWSEPVKQPHPAAAAVADRRVPTLAELDRRLQELRAQDEYEAASTTSDKRASAAAVRRAGSSRTSFQLGSATFT